MSTPRERAFAVAPPGLEGVVREELALLGAQGEVEPGGVSFACDRALLYRVHLHARTPARVWVRLGSFPATTLEALAAGVRRLPWATYVWPRQPIEVRAASHRSRLRHKEAVASKVELAIADALRGPRRTDGARPSKEPIDVLVRIEDDEAEISVDASGELLHRRGWRKDAGEAPLRENLAAACLWLADWAPGEALVDPMCGSGTFVIEAATLARGLPPGRDRTFAFERWPSHEAGRWSTIRSERGAAPVPTVIAGSDRDEGAIRAARANARRAGVTPELVVASVSELVPPAPTGLVIANPPYGERVGGAVAAWSSLGETLRARFGGWRVALLGPNANLVHRTGLALEPAVTFPNGGLRVSLWIGDVRAPAR
jgi:putative N6-adenine-specific DNA methylase